VLRLISSGLADTVYVKFGTVNIKWFGRYSLPLRHRLTVLPTLGSSETFASISAAMLPVQVTVIVKSAVSTLRPTAKLSMFMPA
jgi:hypothetical protein